MSAVARPDFAAEGLLKGLRGQARLGRQELLEQLHDAGVPLEELRQAVAENRLALVPVELALGGEGKYTAAEKIRSYLTGFLPGCLQVVAESDSA